MSATAHATRECYASEHELFDIGLASVEFHATGLHAPAPRTAMRGGADEVRPSPMRPVDPRVAGDHRKLLRLTRFLLAGEVGIALALAGLFEAFDAAHLVRAALLAAGGCALAWYGWHGARALLAMAGLAPARQA